MSNGSRLGGSMAVDVTELRRNLSTANNLVKQSRSEFKAVAATLDDWTKSQTGLEAKIKSLNGVEEAQKSKIEALKRAYQALLDDGVEPTDKDMVRLAADLAREEAALAQTEAETKKYKQALESISTTSAKFRKNISEQERKLADLKEQYINVALEEGKNSKSAKALYEEYKKLEKEITANKDKLNDIEGELEDVDKAAEKAGKGGFTVLNGVLANLATQGINAALNGLKSMGQAAINIGKAAIENYADYEQLVGGVETLFGAGGQSVEEYAKSVGKSVEAAQGEYDKLMQAQTQVLENANNAYNSAGLSANEYMETVTSFSASLLQGLNGDTAKAAKIADQAIIDMSDNANKMGTDISAIQNAYQGFAKGNFTMLDNLKLGYGGTKTEMLRLVKDAGVVEESVQSIDDVSFDQMIEGIHIIQENMGIAGTTAKEASTTIQGSLGAAKSAWSNLLTGIADDSMNFDMLIDNFVNSVSTVAANIIPRVQSAITGIGKLVSGLVEKAIPELLTRIPPIIESTIPIIIAAAGKLVEGFAKIIPAIVALLPTITDSIIQMSSNLIGALAKVVPDIIKALPSAINGIIQGLLNNLPMLIEAAMSLVQGLADGLLQAIPVLVNSLPKIISSIVEFILKSLPKIIKMGGEIIKSLLNGIATSIPQLIAMIPQIVDTIVNLLMENMPLILETGIEAIVALTDGLIQAMPQMLTMMPRIVISMAKAILAHLPQIFKVGIEILSKLISGISSVLSRLSATAKNIVSTVLNKITELPRKMLSKGIEIISSLISGIKSKISNLGDIGLNMVKGIWQGISSGYTWITTKIREWVGNIVDFFKKILKIQSPSQLFADEIGEFLPSGITVGFEKNMPKSLDKMKRNLNEGVKSLKTSVNSDSVAVQGTGSAATMQPQKIVNFNQTIYSPKPVDRLTVYRASNNWIFAAKGRLANV